MLYIMAIILGVAAGILTKGKVSNLMKVKPEKSWLFVTAFAIIIIAQMLSGKFGFLPGYGLITQGLAFSVVLVGFWFNRRYSGVLVIAFGSLLNSMVIMFNGGRMPVSYEAAVKSGLPVEAANFDIKHFVAQLDEGIRLPYLADIINLPGMLGFLMRVVSIGDLVVVAGLFVLFWEIVSGKDKLKNILTNIVGGWQR